MMVHHPERGDKRVAPRATNDRLTPCQACKQGCQECGGTGFVPVEMTGTAGLTWGEQQMALTLLRYWRDAYQNDRWPVAAVNESTGLLLHDHPART